jgi:hypothetical protein
MTGRALLSSRALALSLAAALLVGGAAAGAVWLATPPGVGLPRAAGLTPLSGPSAPAYAVQAALPAQAQVPVRLAIPALDIAAGITPVDAAGGLLEVPGAIREVGWWTAGGIPGAPTGTVVLDGHVDSAVAGLGALWPLRFARPGQLITLGLSDGRAVAYRVIAIRSYPKANLPAGLFSGRIGPATLVLVTCGGSFDRATGHYQDNVVVYAAPTPG